MPQGIRSLAAAAADGGDPLENDGDCNSSSQNSAALGHILLKRAIICNTPKKGINRHFSVVEVEVYGPF